MTTEHIHQLLTGEFSKYLNMAEIARASGTTRQSLKYWLKTNPANSKVNPKVGMAKLKMLCMKVDSCKQLTPELYKKWKKFLNMSILAEQFCGCSSSTMSVTISRKGITHYEKEIKQMNSFLLENLFNTENPNVKTRKNVAIKIKLP